MSKLKMIITCAHCAVNIEWMDLDANGTSALFNPESHHGVLGRTQLFLKTNPAPKGVMCQVQPVKGRELYTHFSIFCSSGKEVFTVS